MESQSHGTCKQTGHSSKTETKQTEYKGLN